LSPFYFYKNQKFDVKNKILLWIMNFETIFIAKKIDKLSGNWRRILTNFHPEKYCFCVERVNKADFDKRGTH